MLYNTTECHADKTHIHEALTVHLADADNARISISGRRDARISRW